MSAINRMPGPRGARFFDQDGKTMFVLVLDGNTRFGPMPATEAHMGEHAQAWRDYLAAAAEAKRDADEAGRLRKAGLEVPVQPGSDFPGRPVIVVKDPPGGRPADRPLDVGAVANPNRGRQAQAR